MCVLSALRWSRVFGQVVKVDSIMEQEAPGWPGRDDDLYKYDLYKYGNHLTPGLTEVRSYAAFFTCFPAEGLRVRFRAIPALKTA